MKTQFVYDEESPKRSVNLSANTDLLRIAKNAGVNLSKTFEEALLEKTRQKLEEQWKEENRDAIDIFNSRIERDGVFAARKRRF